MLKTLFSPELSVSQQLKQLGYLRMFYLVSEVLVTGYCQFQLAIELPWHFIWPIIVIHFTVTAGYFLWSTKRPDLKPAVLFQSILADILVFSGLLYFSGGATNGAISILLLPVATAASLLNWRLSLSLAITAIVSYSTLMFYYYSLEANPHVHHQAQSFSDHLTGMWITFIFSCLLLVWFIGLQSHAVREKQRKIADLRESQLRDEQLIAIATFSANAAHDLATPLSSISLLCDELKHEEGKVGIDTLIEQVQLCRSIVQSISQRAIVNKSNLKRKEQAKHYFTTLVDRWLVTRPELELNLSIADNLADIEFMPDAGLESALTNILDNAADASIDNESNELRFEANLVEDIIELKIEDNGMGISDSLIKSLGNEPVSSEGSGLGLGQFLANATISRCGGKVWRHSSGQGTQTIVTLPLYGELE